MSRLGVVTCQILELEFAHILSKDPDVSEIRVLRDEFSTGLITALESRCAKPVCQVVHLGGVEAAEEENLTVLVRVMEVGLHSNIQNLKRAVTRAVDEIAPLVDAVLLGYGLCGNALDQAETLFKHVPVPVMLPMDTQDPVDDCVGLIIGGREKYYEEQCRCAGTMFMNAGFSRHWQKILCLDVPPKLAHKKEDIMRWLIGNYQRCLLLPTAVLGERALEENTRVFNERYNLRVESREGTLSLLENAWEAAKRSTNQRDG